MIFKVHPNLCPILYTGVLALLVTSCFHNNSNFGSISAAPTPYQLYQSAYNACINQLPTVRMLNDAIITCVSEGIPDTDNVLIAQCVFPKVRTAYPQIFIENPVFQNLENKIKRTIKLTSSAGPIYQSLDNQLKMELERLKEIATEKHLLELTQCDNAATTSIIAPTSNASAAYFEFANERERIALQYQQGRLSKIEGAVTLEKAIANLTSKVEAADQGAYQSDLPASIGLKTFILNILSLITP